jgi:hypothetical protein
MNKKFHVFLIEYLPREKSLSPTTEHLIVQYDCMRNVSILINHSGTHWRTFSRAILGRGPPNKREIFLLPTRLFFVGLSIWEHLPSTCMSLLVKTIHLPQLGMLVASGCMLGLVSAAVIAFCMMSTSCVVLWASKFTLPKKESSISLYISY